MEEKNVETQGETVETSEAIDTEKEAEEAAKKAEVEAAEEESKKESVDRQKSKYVVSVVRDDSLLKKFVKFSNRVKHPRVTGYMLIVGGTLFILPFVNHEIALPGVIICHVMGALMLLMGLFRHQIGVYMLKSNPETRLGEGITYLFGNTGIKTEDDDGVKHLGSYKKIYRLWEDEKIFYIGTDDEELLVLPKENFESGDYATFRDFVLEKSRCSYTWKPVRIDNVIKQFHQNMKANPIRIGFQPKEKK